MKKSLLLLVPIMMLVGCAINGLNPFGNDVNGSAGGMATMTIQVLEPGKGSIDVGALIIIAANFTLVDVQAQTQTTNWAPGLATALVFRPIKAGLTSLTLRDIDNAGWTNIVSTNITVVGGYNYRIVVTLGGGIYLIETNLTAIPVSNDMTLYSETHGVPVGNNVFAQGANLFIWTPALVLTEIGTSSWEGNSNWAVTRAISTTNYIGFGITSTNGGKDKSIYSGGHLNLAVKNANAANAFRIGIQSITGAVTNDAYVDMASQIGYAADGNWHVLAIPMSSFAGINFANVYTYFYLSSTAIQTNVVTTVNIDDIYWSRD